MPGRRLARGRLVVCNSGSGCTPILAFPRDAGAGTQTNTVEVNATV
jgi:hypothetical protein